MTDTNGIEVLGLVIIVVIGIAAAVAGGLYRFAEAPALDKGAHQVRLVGSGAILQQVIAARDLGKLKTGTQALAAGLAGLAAGGAFSDDIAWWTGLVALLITWISGVDYFLSAPRLFRGQQPA